MSKTSRSQKVPKKHPIKFKIGTLEIETDTALGALFAIAMVVAVFFGVAYIRWGSSLFIL